MPEIRKDPVFGRWVIVAAERGLRPNDFRPDQGKDGSNCPFCAGREESTPPTLYSLPGPGGAWRLRVVRNKYPALISGGSPENRREGIYEHMDALGIHEVIIETPEHGLRLEEQPGEAIADVLKTYILRVKEIKKDPGIKYVMIFKNHGRNAGASLLHPHSQLVGLPMSPIRVLQELNGAKQYFFENGSCVFCDIVREESAFEKRIVAQNADFLAITPYASRFSFEMWILPRAHNSHFEDMPEAAAGALAGVLKTVLSKLATSLKDLSYNLIVHTMPVQEPAAENYHWHIEIMPKLSHVAGFEWGTGFYINTISPEAAAEILNSGKSFTL